MPSRWVAKSQATAKYSAAILSKNHKYSSAKNWYNEEALRTMPFKEVRESLKKDVVPKPQTKKSVDTEALRTLPFTEVDELCPKRNMVAKSNGSFDEELLRTMPFKETHDSPSSNSNELSDDEDAMSTSAGSSDGSLGLAESHGPSFAESEEEEQNRGSQDISIDRALLLVYRKSVPFSAPSTYDLRTKPMAECDPVEPEVLVPPGVFPPPGLEDTFDPSQFAMFRAVASDAEELQSLLAKISLELDCLDMSTTTQSAPVARQEQPLQDWIFENAPETAADWGTGEVKDGPYQHLWETHAEKAADVDGFSEWLASLACTPIGMPVMSAKELSCNPTSDKAEDFADFSALFKTGWEMNAGESPSFNMACGAEMDAASEFMAWPQGYEGLCNNWLQHGAVAQESHAWFPSPWSTFNGQWGPSCTSDF